MIKKESVKRYIFCNAKIRPGLATPINLTRSYAEVIDLKRKSKTRLKTRPRESRVEITSGRSLPACRESWYAWLRVYGSRFGVWGMGIQDSNSGFGIRDRDSGFGIRIRDSGICNRDSGFGIRDSGSRFGIRILGFETRVSGLETQDS